MPSRIYVTPIETLISQAEEIIQTSKDPIYVNRVRIVNFVLHGMVPSEVSKIVKKCKTTITSWVKKADEQGFESLIPGKHTGRPKKLTYSELEELKSILSKKPENYGFRVWDGPSMSELIKVKYNKSISVRQCQRLFHELGYSLIRPRTMPTKGENNDEEREEYKKIEELRNNPNVKLVYQDEVHFEQGATITRMWAPKGSAPDVKSPAGRKSLTYSGFVFPHDGRLIMTRPSWFNSDTVIESIREFIDKAHIEEGGDVYLVLDNAPWHKKAIRLIEDDNNPEYEDIRRKIHFLRLPPYSPDLNPIEQVWRITRREVTHNRYFKSLTELENKLNSYFNNFSLPNEKFRSLCSFRFGN